MDLELYDSEQLRKQLVSIEGEYSIPYGSRVQLNLQNWQEQLKIIIEQLSQRERTCVHLAGISLFLMDKQEEAFERQIKMEKDYYELLNTSNSLQDQVKAQKFNVENYAQQNTSLEQENLNIRTKLQEINKLRQESQEYILKKKNKIKILKLQKDENTFEKNTYCLEIEKQLQDINQKLKSTNKENLQILETNKQMQSQFQIERDQNKLLTEQVQYSQDENNKSKQQRDTLNQDIQDYKKQVDRLQQQINEKNEKIKQLTKEKEVYQYTYEQPSPFTGPDLSTGFKTKPQHQAGSGKNLSSELEELNFENSPIKYSMTENWKECEFMEQQMFKSSHSQQASIGITCTSYPVEINDISQIKISRS